MTNTAYSDKDIAFLKALKSQGVAPEEAFARLAKVKVAAIPQENSSSQGDYFGKGFVDAAGNAATTVAGVGANAAATVGEGIGNVANFAGQVGSYLDPIADAGRISKTFTGSEGVFSGYKSPLEMAGNTIQSGMQGLADNARQNAEDNLGVKKDSLTAGVGNVLGTVGNVAAGAGLGAAAGGFAGNAIGQNAGLAGRLAPLGEKVAEYAPKVSQFIGNSLGSTEGVNATMEGNLAGPGQLATGLVTDTALLGASKVANKLGNYFFSRIIPTTPLQAGKDAAKGLNLGKTVAEETGISMNKSQVQQKISSKIKALSNELDGLIKKADAGDVDGLVKFGEKAGFTADDLFPEGSVEKVLKNKKLQLKFGDVEGVKSQITSTLEEFKQTVGDNVLNLDQVQTLKKQLGNSLSGLYSKTGDAKATAKELVNDIIRSNAKKVIETHVAPAAEINKRLSNLITAEKRISAKGNYSGYLTDLIAGMGYGSAQGMAGQNDPASYAKNILLGVIGKRLVGSTAAKTIAGTALKNLNKAAPAISAGAKAYNSKLTPSK